MVDNSTARWVDELMKLRWAVATVFETVIVPPLQFDPLLSQPTLYVASAVPALFQWMISLREPV